MVISAITGSLIYIMYLFFLIRLGVAVKLIVNALSAGLMTYIAFGAKKDYFFRLFSIYAVTFVFGGTVEFIYEATNLYGDIIDKVKENYSMMFALIIGFIIVSVGIKVYVSIWNSKVNDAERYYSVDMTYKGKTYSFRALLDTGNSLVEPFSRKMVCVVEASKIIDKSKLLMDRMYVIPYSSVGVDKGVLYGFRADEILLRNEDNESEHRIVDVIIAIYEGKLSNSGKYNMLLHKDII